MDRIEKLSRRRRAMLAIYGAMFLVFQGLGFTKLDEPLSMWRAIHWVTLAGYLCWALSLIYILGSGGFLFRSTRAENAVLNDELTRANRLAGYKTGYIAVMAMLVALMVLNAFEPMTVNETVRYAFAIGVAAPAIRFAGLERRQGA